MVAVPWGTDITLRIIGRLSRGRIPDGHCLTNVEEPRQRVPLGTTDHTGGVRMWKALDVLSPRRRMVVVMHELEDLDISSIASLLGISSITVRWHLSRGRRELARAIRPDSAEIQET